MRLSNSSPLVTLLLLPVTVDERKRLRIALRNRPLPKPNPVSDDCLWRRIAGGVSEDDDFVAATLAAIIEFNIFFKIPRWTSSTACTEIAILFAKDAFFV